MFTGTFSHTLDAKNRLVVPSKFRLFVKDPEDRMGFFVSVNVVGQERCLRLFTKNGWREFSAKVRQSTMGRERAVDFMRFFFANTEFVVLDKQSRLVLPQKLIDLARLQRNVVLNGMGDWIEVWNEEEWKQKSESLGRDFSVLYQELFKLNP